MKHTHHIVPKYMGGSDDPTNLVELTVEEHAEAHRILYETYGHWQDKVAWQGLLGLIDHKEIVQEMYNARKGTGNFFYGKKHTDETKRKISESNKGRHKGKPKPNGFSENLSKKNSGSGNPMYGKTPWNKGKSCPASMSSKIKKGQPVIYKGIEYYGITEAARANNTSRYHILKECIFVNKSESNE